MRFRWYQRSLSVVLALVMLVQLVPGQCFGAAAEVADVTSEDVSTAPVEIVGEETGLRSEREKHFRLSDGSFMAVSYGVPVHYQDEDGQWKDIDNTLTFNEAGDAYYSSNAQMDTAFSADLSTGRVMTTAHDGTAVSMSLLSRGDDQKLMARSQGLQSGAALDTTTEAVLVEDAELPEILAPQGGDGGWSAEELIPQTLRSTVLYEDVYPGVDLVYTAYSYHIKEQIVVKRPQTSYRYDFLLELDGVTAVLNEDQTISLVDSKGDIQYTIPAPYMEDSNGATSYEVNYTLSQVSGGIVLSVEADGEWIDAEGRAFPVTIDPTLEVAAGSSDADIYATYVTQGAPDATQAAYQHLYAGYGSEDVQEQQVVMHFNRLPTIPGGATVTEAQLSMYMFDTSYEGCTDISVGVYEVTTGKPAAYSNYHEWISQLSWNTKPSYKIADISDYVTLEVAAEDEAIQGYYDWDMTKPVRRWYDEGTENRTVVMAVASERAGLGPDLWAVPGFMARGDAYPPLLVVSYRVDTGIEDCFTYATLGAGAAGTAYIADHSGKLTVVRELASYASTISPFSLSLVYEGTLYSTPDSPIYDQFPQTRPVGRGWRLDAQQWVVPETVGGKSYIKYCDGDGTIHYFSRDPEDPENQAYHDEDGLGLTITPDEGPGSYTMTGLQGDTLHFSDGILDWTQNNNGDRYTYHYSSGRLARITQKNNGTDAEITVATLTYNGDLLGTVLDAAGRMHELCYTDGLLTSILLEDATVAEYTYSNGLAGMEDSESGYSIHFDNYWRGTVMGYTEFDREMEQGARVVISYDSSGKTTYQDYGADRTAWTEDDIFTYFLLDHSGRTVNVYSTDANSNVLGASMAAYFDGGATDRRNNRTIRTASIGAAAEQELLNSGFEGLGHDNVWTISEHGWISSLSPRTGNFSFRADVPNPVTHVWASKQSEYLYSGKTYTLSAYVNTSQMSKTEGIYLTVSDATGHSWKGDDFGYRTLGTVDDGWMRISLSFTAETNGVHTVSVNCLGGIGEFFVDDLQLERGEAPSGRNMLENGNMQALLTGWTIEGAHPTTSSGMFREDGQLRAISIPGMPQKDQACISQVVAVGLPGTQSYILSGWARADAVPDNVDTAEDYAQDKEKSFGLRATVKYSDGTKEYFYGPFDAEVTDWQFNSLSITPTQTAKTVSSITVACVYENNANTADFDNISLVRGAVQELCYDTDGNLVSAQTTGQTADVDTYEDGDLVQTVTGTGTTYSYTYDEEHAHRLLSYTDGTTTQSMSYDSFGNVESTTFRANEGTGLGLMTTASFSSDGNRQLSATDANGITTDYVYSTAISQMLGQPTRVQEPDGAATDLFYDVYGRITQTVGVTMMCDK